MQILAWNDYLKTGIDIVDQQHRGLVDMTNETASRLSSPEGLSPDDLRTLLGYLVDYAEIHFSTEEALMALSGVDERHAEHHRHSHIRFLDQVKTMATELGEGGLTGQQMMDFLGNWLIYHMLGEDRNMGRQLQALSGGVAPEQAFEDASGKPLDPAQEAATRSLSRLYAFMARQNQQLLATEREQRNRSEHLKELVASRTSELNASEERFRALFHNGVLPMIIVPLDQSLMPGRVVESNPAARDLLGYEEEELLSLAPRDFVAPEEMARFPLLISELLATGRFQCEMTHVTKDGRRFPAHVNMIHFVMHGHLATMSIIQDISERKAAELAQKEAREAEERLARARSEFLGALEQDVSIPRQGVLGLAPPSSGGGIGGSQAAAFLARQVVFREVAPEDLAQLAAASRERRLARGEILFHKGDRPRGLYLVISGQIKLAISSAQGNEKVLGIFGPQQTFGEAEVVMDSPYPFFAQSLSEAIVLMVSQAELLEVLDRDRSLARGLLGCLGNRLHGLVHDVESYTLRTGTERVIGYLLQHAYLHAGGRLEVELPARKQVIASLLHLTPETLSRIFHDLSEERLIEVKGRHVHIPDTDKLTAWQAAEAAALTPGGRRRSASA